MLACIGVKGWLAGHATPALEGVDCLATAVQCRVVVPVSQRRRWAIHIEGSVGRSLPVVDVDAGGIADVNAVEGIAMHGCHARVRRQMSGSGAPRALPT